MNRLTLLSELTAAGVTPPAQLDNETLFEVADAIRRSRAGESPRRGTPEAEVWPDGRLVSRALFLLS